MKKQRSKSNYPVTEKLIKDQRKFKFRLRQTVMIKETGEIVKIKSKAKNTKGNLYLTTSKDFPYYLKETEIELFDNRKIVKVKKYEFKIIHYSNGDINFSRENDGFNPIELLGVLTNLQLDIKQQMAGLIKPTYVSRKVIGGKK